MGEHECLLRGVLGVLDATQDPVAGPEDTRCLEFDEGAECVLVPGREGHGKSKVIHESPETSTPFQVATFLALGYRPPVPEGPGPTGTVGCAAGVLTGTRQSIAIETTIATQDHGRGDTLGTQGAHHVIDPAM